MIFQSQIGELLFSHHVDLIATSNAIFYIFIYSFIYFLEQYIWTLDIMKGRSRVRCKPTMLTNATVEGKFQTSTSVRV